MTSQNKTEVELLEDFVISSFCGRNQKSGVEPIWKHSLRVGKECKEYLSRLNLDNDKIKYVGYIHDILHDTKVTEETLSRKLSSIFNLPVTNKKIIEIIDICKKMNREKNQDMNDYLSSLRKTNNDVLYIVKAVEMRDKLKSAIKNYACFKERWNYCIANSKKFIIPMLECKTNEYADVDSKFVFSELKYFFEKVLSDSESNFNSIFKIR